MRILRVLLVLFLAACLVCAGFIVARKRIERRLRSKAAEAEMQIRIIATHGGDPSAILAILQQVRPALDAGHPHEAEAMLDHARTMAAQALKTLRQPINPICPSMMLRRRRATSM
jgi:hypothetical protein